MILRPDQIGRWNAVFLALWAVGAQLGEPIAAAGMIGTVLGGAAVFLGPNRPAPFTTFVRAWTPLWAFVLWSLAGPLLGGLSPSPTGAARVLDWVALPWAAVAFSRLDAGTTRRIAAVAGGALILSSAVAGLQHAGLWPALDFFQRWQWTKIPFYRVYEPVQGAPERFMGGGLLFHRLKFAHVSGLAAVVFLAAGLRATGTWRLLAIVAAALATLAVWLFPFARAASLALFAAELGVVVLSAPTLRRSLWLGLPLAVVALAVFLGYAPFRERVLSARTPEGSGSRVEIMASGLEAIRSHPLTGVGAGHFSPWQFAGPDASDALLEQRGKAHNQFLTLAAETGLPGLVLFLALLFWLYRSLRRETSGGLAALGALIFFLLLSFLHDPLFHPEFSMGLVLSVALGTRKPQRSSPP